MAQDQPAEVPTYVIYNKRNGAFLQRHRTVSADGSYLECDEEKLLKQFLDDEEFLDLVETKDDVAIVRVDMSDAQLAGGGYLIDPKERSLVPRHKIVLTPDKIEIEGDGSDKAKFTLHIEDPDGKKRTEFNGEVKLTVNRGKLSARGGVLEVKKGKAEFTLTSVAETVDRVTVKASSPDRTLSPAMTFVAFV